jgi:glycosyltransferase involved in cell wall biosynthesis
MAVISILTCNRPHELTASINSVLEANNSVSSITRLIVIDDSKDQTVSVQNRKKSTLMQEKYETPVQYVGLKEKKTLIEALCCVVHSGITDDSSSLHEQLQFALTVKPYSSNLTTHGRNCNAELLCAAGKNLISFDDDIICRLSTLSLQNIAGKDTTNIGFQTENSFNNTYLNAVFDTYDSLKNVM